MYSYEDRMRAVELYIQYDRSAAATIRELGYPSRKGLDRWYQEYEKSGDLHRSFPSHPKFSDEQKQVAVDYYIYHGHNLSRTVRALGYPSRTLLSEWIDELRPGIRKGAIRCGSAVSLTDEQKRRAVIDLCSRTGSANAVAESVGVTPQALYAWKRKLLGEGAVAEVKKKNETTRSDDQDELLQEVEALQKKIHKLQLEHDVLKKANELLKKDQGIDPQILTNREKTLLIDALRATYAVSELLRELQMPRSSYFYHQARLQVPEKYALLRSAIIRVFEANEKRYGYRRVHIMLQREGILISEKIVRRIMVQEKLIVVGTKRRRYSSYKGEISPSVENLIDRDFHADDSNEKWLTDITEFQIPAGKAYLSPMIDCFDGLVVSWTIGTSPDAELVNTMLDMAINGLSEGKLPIVHSDRGSHYRWPGWISRMDQAGLTRSMSKKGCTPDNAACEGFFGRLKNEMYYNKIWIDVSMQGFIDQVDQYIRWYNEQRIKLSLGGMSPVEYRQSIGKVA
ncbi:MAG: IS3 family transposase [Spirochaeta sp.]|nr:IS3 family transposase [Spirochaeta sp.]